MIEGAAILVVIAILPLAVPIRIGVGGAVNDETTALQASVRILFGALAVRITYNGQLSWQLNLGPIGLFSRDLVDSEKQAEDSAKEDESESEEEAPQKTVPEKGIKDKLSLAFAYGEIVKRPGLKLLARLTKTLWLRKLEARGRFGTGSPDSTGRAAGLIYAADGVASDRIRLDLTPDFGLSGFRGSFRIELAFWLGFLLLAVIWAALVIGTRFGVWYLQQKLAGIRRPKAQTA